MAGLIKSEDIAAVRERSRIDEIVGQHLTLRPAGVGSLKGLCPFHDERSPSFHVRPHLGLWHCFGCGEGGDVISFVQKIDHLPFTDAVEYLASKVGITLRYEQSDGAVRAPTDQGRRSRLLDAHRSAAQFYTEQLNTEQAAPARQFLLDRGFSPQQWAEFGVGYAPKGWDNLYSHLRAAGFSDSDLLTGGLVSQGNRGVYDRFRGRLMWPIRDTSGQVIGFGARKLYDDDPGPKYLNTPETPIYRKSHVLYGIDLAKKSIATDRQVVVVEGYTDVMAMHVAGITSAVATCGTAFGADHIRVVRRMMGDNASPSAGVILTDGRAVGGKIIFTFDADEAGKKAALRAFEQDQKFAAQTFIAVAEKGMDPCDLRLAEGDGALHALIKGQEPLFRFALRNALTGVDITTGEGRVAGVRLGAPVVAQIRDQALRREYIRELAGWMNMPIDGVQRAVHDAIRAPRQMPEAPMRRDQPGGERQDSPAPASQFRELITTGDPVVRTQRQAIEIALKFPTVAAAAGFDDITPEVFSVPALAELAVAIAALGGVAGYSDIYYRIGDQQREQVIAAGGDPAAVDAGAIYDQSLIAWADAVREQVGAELDPLITQLAVAPVPHDQPSEINSWAAGVIRALARYGINREIATHKSRLARLDGDDPQAAELFAHVVALENRRRQLEDVN